MCEGSEQGLHLIDDLLARERLSHYHLAHSARADLCRRLGRIPEARASYQKALAGAVDFFCGDDYGGRVVSEVERAVARDPVTGSGSP
jgi:hypothetical protein